MFRRRWSAAAAAVLVGVLVLGERLTPARIAGLAAIFAGVLVSV